MNDANKIILIKNDRIIHQVALAAADSRFIENGCSNSGVFIFTFCHKILSISVFRKVVPTPHEGVI